MPFCCYLDQNTLYRRDSGTAGTPWRWKALARLRRSARVEVSGGARTLSRAKARCFSPVFLIVTQCGVAFILHLALAVC